MALYGGKKIANDTTAATKAVRQNEYPYWRKKEENVSYYVSVNSKPDHQPPPPPLKISQDPRRLHEKHAKENQTLFTFLTTENLSGLLCSHQCKYGVYSDLSSYAVTLAE